MTRPTPAVLELLMALVKLANDRKARNELIRFIADHLGITVRALGQRVGMSHASVIRIRDRRQSRGETGARSRAAKHRRR